MASDKDIEGWLNDHTGSVQTPSPAIKAPADAEIEGWLNDKGQQQPPQSIADRLKSLVGPDVTNAVSNLMGPTLPEAPQGNMAQQAFGVAKSFLAPGGIVRGPATLEALYKQNASNLGEAVGSKIVQSGGNPNLAGAAGMGTELLADPSTYLSLMAGKMGLNRVNEIATSGARIGAAEKAAGVITKAADKYPTSGNVGEVLNTLEGQLDNGTLTNPQELQQANSIVRFVFNNPNIVGKEKAVLVQAARVAQKVNGAFNDAVPGRAPAAADFATLMKYVNAAKTAGKVTAGVSAAGAALGTIRKFLHGG